MQLRTLGTWPTLCCAFSLCVSLSLDADRGFLDPANRSIDDVGSLGLLRPVTPQSQ